MQSAHQTFLTIGLGTAIILGAADAALAQTEDAKVRVATSDALDLPIAPSPAQSEVLDNGPRVVETLAFFPSERHDALVPINLDAVDSSWDIRLQQVNGGGRSPIMAGEIGAGMGPLAQGTAGSDPELDPAPPVETLPLDLNPTREPANEDDLTPENAPAFPEAEAPIDLSPGIDSVDEGIEPVLDGEDNASDALGVEAPEDNAPETDASLGDDADVLIEIEIPVDGDEGLEGDLDGTEIPAYLLSPSNPLFVPTRPETVDIEGTQPLSLDEALAIAYQNSRELQVAIQQLEQSQQALRQARADYFPTITTSSQLVHSDTDISNESGLGSLDGLPTVDTNLNLNVTLNYDIFTSGLRAANVRAAKDAVRIQELEVEEVQEDLRLTITNAYYDLQESDEGVRIAMATVEESEQSLQDASARERAGVGTRFDRLQAEVQLANDEQALTSSVRDQRVARRQLAELLSLPPGINVSASDRVQVAGAWELPLEETLLLAYRNRVELEQQLVQRDLERQQRRAAIASRWPQLSLFASYEMNDLLDNTRVSQDQEVLSAGLQLNWTLYNGGATRAQARQEEISAELAETAFADEREAIRFEVEQEYLNLGAEFQNIQTANAAIELAEESLKLARLRFGAGVGIQSDVLEAQTQLTQAEGNRVSAILDYNRALVGIQRAVSNWPDNNLSADPLRDR